MVWWWSVAQIVGQLFGALAAYFMWLGSRETPHSIRTWSGKSDKEKAFRRRRAKHAKTGIALLGVSFILQAILQAISYWLRAGP
jgi:hypothetical protein